MYFISIETMINFESERNRFYVNLTNTDNKDWFKARIQVVIQEMSEQYPP